MRLSFVLAALLLVLAAAPPAVAYSLTLDGERRTWTLRLPAGVERPPLILVLHGGGGRGRQIERHSGMTEAALPAGFAVAYPDGLHRQWNDGRGDLVSAEKGNLRDDVAFLTALIDRLAAEGSIDPARVYVMGISNGGMMTYRLLCEAAGRFAGAVAIVANLGEEIAPACQPARPVPLMVLNGTDDPLVPYQGGAVTVFEQERGRVLSTEATLARFATVNGCAGREQLAAADPAPQDGVTPEHVVYQGCAAPLELWRFVGGGHGWPGASQYLGKRLIGVVPDGPSATALAVEFFRRGG